jgi:hypothetical protein
MLLAVAKRFGIILLGYVVACYVAGLAMGRLTIILRPDMMGGITEDTGTANNSLLEAAILSVPVGIFMAIPTFLTLPFLEAWEVRNPLVYGLVGGAWGTLLFVLIFRTDLSMALVFALSGVIAGLVYWAVAGRRAGQVWK